MRFMFWFFLGGVFISACRTPKKAIVPSQIIELEVGFYNVENLFDTIDNPDKFDDDFTPEGRNQYTSDRYLKKLDQLAKVIEAMNAPAILGLCEVENKPVIEKMIQNERLKKYNYGVVHFESPDKRGIDNALIYQPQIFEFKGAKILRFEFPDEVEPDYTSRDVLIVRGNISGVDIHVLVNHFPSRRGGVEASEPKRIFVAEHVKKAVDSLHALGTGVLVMGDFNDEPSNRSIQEVLCENDDLVNLFSGKETNGEGSYNYRGNWNMLDQVLVSKKMTVPGNKVFASNPVIFREEWMMYRDKRFGATPSRTYGGPNYYGGYSDHLPVKIKLMIKK